MCVTSPFRARSLLYLGGLTLTTIVLGAEQYYSRLLVTLGAYLIHIYLPLMGFFLTSSFLSFQSLVLFPSSLYVHLVGDFSFGFIASVVLLKHGTCLPCLHGTTHGSGWPW